MDLQNPKLVRRTHLPFDWRMADMMYDALVIGGGPGGSSTATFLARARKCVLVLEKERFPRFHIGESLLPYNRRLLADMDILETQEKSGFWQKQVPIPVPLPSVMCLFIRQGFRQSIRQRRCPRLAECPNCSGGILAVRV